MSMHLPVDTITTKHVTDAGRLNIGGRYSRQRVVYGIIDARPPSETLPVFEELRDSDIHAYVEELLANNEDVETVRREINAIRDHARNIDDEDMLRRAKRAHKAIQTAMFRAAGLDIEDGEHLVDGDGDPLTRVRRARRDDGIPIPIDLIEDFDADTLDGRGRITVGSKYEGMDVTLAILDARDPTDLAPYAPLDDEDFADLLSKTHAIVEHANDRGDVETEALAAEVSQVLQGAVSGEPAEDVDEDDVADAMAAPGSD